MLVLCVPVPSRPRFAHLPSSKDETISKFRSVRWRNAVIVTCKIAKVHRKYAIQMLPIAISGLDAWNANNDKSALLILFFFALVTTNAMNNNGRRKYPFVRVTRCRL